MAPAARRKKKDRRRARHRHRGQLCRRRREREVRKRAVAVARCATAKGKSLKEAAGWLDLSPERLRQWRRDWRKKEREPVLRGRPPEEIEPERQREVFALLDLLGPRTGMPTLGVFFPHLPHRALEDLLVLYHRLARRGRTEVIPTLRWSRPGTVWAMDHTNPDNAVDGIYKTILVVRDLASGRTLASLPLARESAESTAALLRSLFLAYGAPLVIKSDNGGALTGEEVKALLAAWNVVALVSPPYYPRYNGACEAGVGAIKIRAHHIAARHGREGCWSASDVEAARQAENELVRPGGRSPDAIWKERNAVSEEDRENLRKAMGRARKELDEEQTGTDNAQRGSNQAQRQREAIARALGRLGILTVRRRRIPLPV